MRNQLMLGLVVVAGAANANIVIDDFTSGTYHKTITSGSITEFQNGTMIGGDRYANTMVESNVFGLEIQTDIAGGSYALSAQSGVDGMGSLGYGFSNNAGTPVNQDMNLNFSGENQFKVNFISSDAPGTYTISVRSSSSNGGAFVSVTDSFQGNSVNAPFMRTLDFSQFAGVNFADVDQVVLKFDSSTSGDVAISSFQAVPEPASLIVLGTASAFAARRRRKN
ncbi:MAG: PEP-CTERM sorting domain-containing protein [Fimbriimonadaceae bacterium]